MKNKHYEFQFVSRLSRVYTHGVAEILKEEIKLWFGVERVARNTWREIIDTWREDILPESERDQITLLVGGLESDLWVFVWGEGNGTTAESYLQDVRFLAGYVQADGSPREE